MIHDSLGRAAPDHFRGDLDELFGIERTALDEWPPRFKDAVRLMATTEPGRAGIARRRAPSCLHPPRPGSVAISEAVQEAQESRATSSAVLHQRRV
jgi:hypothetical protein